MSKRLLDYDPLTREATWVSFSGDVMELHQYQDVRPVIEWNKALQKEEDYSRAGIKNDWWHYATIPNGVAHQWLREGINIYTREGRARAINEKLSQPEWRDLKATTKKHRSKAG